MKYKSAAHHLPEMLQILSLLSALAANAPIQEAPDLKLQTPPPHALLMEGVGRFHTFNGFGYKM